jgi:tetratricopeptide (TPR) repeat protein
MENSELNQLIELLDNPFALKQKIEILRLSSNLMEETEGFIRLYDVNKEDCSKIKEYLIETKSKIVSPLKNKNRFSTYLKYAAVFALILATIAFFNNRQENVMSLSHQFEEPGLINYMSASKTSNFEDIMYDFKTKNYLKAEEEIEKILFKEPKNDTLIYFLGVIEFKLNKFKEAKIQLQKIQKLNTSIYIDRSIYYLGIIEYKKRHFTEANNIFKSLYNSNDLDVKNASFEHINELQSLTK